MSYDVVIQARMGSTRLPGKVLKKYKNFNILKILITRLKKSKKIGKIIISTTKNKEDDKIVKFSKLYNLDFFRGSENDVLKRYFDTAKNFKLKNIIRITADCPFIDSKILDHLIEIYKNKKLDYCSNTYPEPSTYPDGMDIEIFNFKTLSKARKNAKTKSEKEHVTVAMRNSRETKMFKHDLSKDFSNLRLTVDYPEDFILFKKIIDYFNNQIYSAKMIDLINFLKKNPRSIEYQKKIIRNESLLTDLKFDGIQ